MIPLEKLQTMIGVPELGKYARHVQTALSLQCCSGHDGARLSRSPAITPADRLLLTLLELLSDMEALMVSVGDGAGGGLIDSMLAPCTATLNICQPEATHLDCQLCCSLHESRPNAQTFHEKQF